MVNMDKIQRGIALFIDREMMPNLSGWEKVLIGGGATIAVAKLPNIILQYPIIAAMGLYDKETNQMDIDTLYQSVVLHIGTEPLPVKIPVLGMTVKVGKQEIDALYKYIKEV